MILRYLLVLVLFAVVSSESTYAMMSRRLPIRMLQPSVYTFWQIQLIHNKAKNKACGNTDSFIGDAALGVMGGMLGIGTGMAWGAAGGALTSLPVAAIGLLVAPSIEPTTIMGVMIGTGMAIGGVAGGFEEAAEWGGKAGVVGLGAFLAGTTVGLGCLEVVQQASKNK